MKKIILLILTIIISPAFAGPSSVYCPEEIACDPQGMQSSCRMVGGNQNYFELNYKTDWDYKSPYKLAGVVSISNSLQTPKTICYYYIQNHQTIRFPGVISKTILEASVKDFPKWRVVNEYAYCDSSSSSDCPLKLWNPNKKI